MRIHKALNIIAVTCALSLTVGCGIFEGKDDKDDESGVNNSGTPNFTGARTGGQFKLQMRFQAAKNSSATNAGLNEIKLAR